MSGPPLLLRGVDRAAFAVSFALRLRAAGVPVGFTGIDRFTRALQVSPPHTRVRLYWAARVSMVSRPGELPAFDAVFAAVFDDAVLRMDPHSRRNPPTGAGEEDRLARVGAGTAPEQDGSGVPWLTLPPVIDSAEDAARDQAVPERTPAALAALADRPFEQLRDADLDTLAGWLSAVQVSWPARRTRRSRPCGSGGRIAVRPTLARARRTGWEPVELVTVRAVDRPRRVVVLLDVSQSMQAQVPAYLHLARVLTRVAGAEVFAFGTSLTRLTPALSNPSPEVAVALAAAAAPDRFGGTRIAATLAQLLSSHHGGLTRGALVLVGSDGWDSGDPGELAAVMARLRRRAYRIVWMNPRASAPGVVPAVSSMAAALPLCHAHVPGATFGDLAGVIDELARRR